MTLSHRSTRDATAGSGPVHAARAALRRQRHPLQHQHGPALAVTSAAICGAVLALSGLLGLAVSQPFLFPSLGPTLMLLAETPERPSARPRNVLIGHLVGVAAGWASLAATGLLHHSPALQEGITGRRIVAAALSLAVTPLVLQLLHAPHPPAGATTLLVSLGLMRDGGDLAVIVLAVVLCTVLTIAVREVFHRRIREADPNR